MTLQVKYIGQSRAYAKCSEHEDKRPSVAINLDGPHVCEWHCFSCGKSGRISNDALIKMSNHKKHTTKPLTNFNWQGLSDKYAFDYIWELGTNIKPFEVTDTVLQMVGCGWDGEAWTFPERNENNEIVGIMRRFPDSFKVMVDGSQRGLYLPHQTILEDREIVFIPELPLLITEGVSDLCTVLDLGYQGIGKSQCSGKEEMIVAWLKNNGYIS
jgi:hypothetical protein